MICAVFQFEALGWQPSAREVRPEAQRADFVVGPGVFRGQSGGEALGVGGVGDGWVPAAPVAARDGVETFVDDGVVAVAAADDIPLHRDLLCFVESVDPVERSVDHVGKPVEGVAPRSDTAGQRGRREGRRSGGTCERRVKHRGRPGQVMPNQCR